MIHFNNVRFYLSLLLLFTSNSVLLAQEKGKILSRYYSPKEYNGGTQNWDIAQDKRGVLYFGNQIGVIEYDGENWRTIPLSNNSTVRSLSINNKGKVFVGGVEEFGYLCPNLKGNLEYHSLKHLLDSLQQHFGDIWSTECIGDDTYFLSDNYIFKYSNSEIKYWDKTQSYFYLMFNINNNIFIHEVGKGLLKMENDKLSLIEDGGFFADKRIHTILPYNNKLIIGTRYSGLYIYNSNNDKKRITKYSAISSQTKELNDFFIKNTIYSGTQISDSTFAISTLSGGAVIFNINGIVSDVINNESTDIPRTIHCLYYSPQQSLWLGLGNGIGKVNISQPFRYWNEKNGINGTITDLIGFDNKLYVASSTGIYHFDREAKKKECNISSFTKIDEFAEQVWVLDYFMPPDSINNLKKSDKKKNNYFPIKKPVLIAGTNQGLFLYKNNKRKEIFDFKSISTIFQSEKHPGEIFIGLRKGIALISYKDGNWYNHGMIKGIKSSVRTIKEDEKGNIWFTEEFNGLYKINIESLLSNDKTQVWENNKTTTYHFDTTNGLPCNTGIVIHHLEDQMKFSCSTGFYNYNDSNKTFTPDTSIGDNYADSSWSNIPLIRLGNDTWINTANKRCQNDDGSFCGDSITFKPLSETIINNGFIETDSIFWFGTSDGLFRYTYADQDFNTKFNAIIRSVYANDSLIFNGTNYKIDKKNNVHITNNTNINIKTIIPYKNNSIKFLFASTFYDDESDNTYSYYLEGYDKKWSLYKKNTHKEYTNLFEGNYIFHIKAKNRYSSLSYEASFSFEIETPWHRTVLVYAIYVIMTIIIILIIVKLYTQQLRKEKNKLEELVQERTKEIKKQANNLKKANIELLKLSKVASETENAITIFDEDGNIQWVNTGFTKMYGFTLEEFKKVKSSNILEVSENPNIVDEIKLCINTKQSIQYEFKTTNKNGQEIWAQTTLTHVEDIETGQIIIIAIETDITKLKLAEIEILKQKSEIEKQRDNLALSNATKNKFFRIIAHDLRSPISTLVSSSSFILDDMNTLSTQKTKQFLFELNKLSQNTFNLLENLLDWTSNQTGNINFLPKEIDLELIILENIELHQKNIEIKNINFTYAIPSEIKVYADENMIKTVIRNLLSNALKFTPHGGNITIIVYSTENFVVTDIEDNGIGINPKDIDKLFKIDTHHSTLGTDNEKGSGLGLILCKEFIEKNHGSISIQSEIDTGSKFTISLPKNKI
ncbi:MAG: ATP-binding protein [Bacteroidales bacterium]|jgi:PAS domain S-box-containing protein|nr:ATP-binding protein [Bacteroidales bacterium]